MFGSTQFVIDRHNASRQLAEALADLKLDQPFILALPRRGEPVASEVAKALAGELDVLIVRKIGAPRHPEYGIGAVVDGNHPQTVRRCSMRMPRTSCSPQPTISILKQNASSRKLNAAAKPLLVSVDQST